MLTPLKDAVVPEKVVVPMNVPLFKSVIPVIPVEGEPEFCRVRLVTVTGEPLGLFRRTWTTPTFAAPGSWVELDGAEGPVMTDTVTEVGVKVGVEVAVGVAEFVAVGVWVKVKARVEVEVRVEVAVGVEVKELV